MVRYTHVPTVPREIVALIAVRVRFQRRRTRRLNEIDQRYSLQAPELLCWPVPWPP